MSAPTAPPRLDLAALWQRPNSEWLNTRDRWIPPDDEDDDEWPAWLAAKFGIERAPWPY